MNSKRQKAKDNRGGARIQGSVWAEGRERTGWEHHHKHQQLRLSMAKIMIIRVIRAIRG